MLRLLTAIFLALILCSCSSRPKVEELTFPDQKLLKSWQSFREAVNKSDTTALISLSHSCILCTVCFSPDTVGIISAQEFYRQHFRNVFNGRLVSFMNDSTRIRAAYDNNSTFPERDSCLVINAVTDNKLADVFVNIRGGDKEGLSVLIHFVKIDSLYKFYGISTMP